MRTARSLELICLVAALLSCAACEQTTKGTTTCDPAKCTGCCNGNACVPAASQTNVLCGTNDLCGSCGADLSCQQGACTANDVCAANNGGCDVHATCTPPPGKTRCACTAGFKGDGVTCLPQVNTLTVRPGALSPAFRPDLEKYIVVVPAATTSVTVTATTVTAGASIAINGTGNASVMVSGAKTEVGVQSVLGSLKSTRYSIDVIHSATSLSERGFIKASNTRADHRFGRAIALSANGLVMAVGATGEDSNATGIGGTQTNTTAARSGAVYVFRRASTALPWLQEAYLKASNAQAADGFGWAVRLSSDGSTLAVGAPGEDSDARGVGGNQASNGATDSGAVYVFRRAASAWTQEAYLKGSNADPLDAFGWTLGLSDDGAKLVIGAPFEDGASNATESSGAVYVFARAGAAWSEVSVVRAQTPSRNFLFGKVVALSGDGASLAVGSPSKNAVSVYRGSASFVFDADLRANTKADDQFGTALALSNDGVVLAVGAPSESTLAVGVNPTVSTGTAQGSGAVYVMRRAGTSWAQEAFVKATNTHDGDAFGSAVALSGNGTTLACGAPSEDSDSRGLEGIQSLVTGPDSGAVFLYRLTSGTWGRLAYVKASNAASADGFGAAVALTSAGSGLLASAPGDDSNATGLDGDSMNDSAMESGACFAFGE